MGNNKLELLYQIAGLDEMGSAVARAGVAEIRRLEGEVMRFRGLLAALSVRHEWSPGLGPCVCDEHEAARRALAGEGEPTE